MVTKEERINGQWESRKPHRSHLVDNSAQQPMAASQTTPSPIEDIERLASLLERSLLTQAEFDAKKKQLLGL